MKTKKCSKCLIEQDINNFYKGKTKDGYRPFCKSCWLKQSNKNKPVWLNKIKSQYGLGIRAITHIGFKKALFIYDRAKRKCEQCKTEFDLTIHHKDGNGRHNIEKHLPQNNDVNNLQILCRSCHGRLHSIKYWKEYHTKNKS